MRVWTLLLALLLLAGCDGGGGGVLGSISSSPPTTPGTPGTPGTPAGSGAFPATTTSTQFAAVGASHSLTADQGPLLGSGDQLQVRYVSSSNSYEVQLPQSQTWATISFLSSGAGPTNFGGNTATLWIRVGNGYQYSRLFEWADKGSTIGGHEAIGIATPAGGVPINGSATYLGNILGVTTENHSDGSDLPLDGSISLLFNFGAGSLSGSISPSFHQTFAADAVGPISFRDTVYSTGSTTFSGGFDTTATGVNSFSGLFTGPNAQELIGNFAFPYKSPIDGQTYQADGAFGPEMRLQATEF